FAALGIIYPFAWMVSASFKRPADIFEFPIKWIPDYLYLDNYQYIFTNKTYDFLGMYGNSIKVTVISVAGALLVSILAAYGFSKLKFPGRDKIFLLFIAMMIIPNQVLMVPRFIIFQWLGIINTHAALIIPGFFVILNTFLLRQYFVQIPDAISESAFIDGANHLRICFQIIVPLAKPIITTFIIVVATVYWNDYDMPLVLLRSKELFTVPVGLAYFSMAMRYGATEFHYLMAGATISILPLMIIFFLGQKQFIEGLTAGAVKG
ncbi:MAG: carbohydrate ABC transporter permease, partial [Ruthenibacterium sp.]